MRPIGATPVSSIALRCVALVLLLFAAACSQPKVQAPETQAPGGWHTFEGTWSASGTRQVLNLEANHRASIFDMTGSLLLVGDRGLGVGFRAKVIAFSDNLAGMQGRCVWTDERGDQVFSELKGAGVGTGDHIVGTFLEGPAASLASQGNIPFSGSTLLRPRMVQSVEAP